MQALVITLQIVVILGCLLVGTHYGGMGLGLISGIGLVVLVVVADAFCHSMVRSLAGAGLAVGRGRRDADWPARLLAARSRDSAAPVAPAHALTLAGVSYPPDDRLGERAELSRALRSLPADRDCGC